MTAALASSAFGPIEPSSTHRFTSADGTELHGASYLADHPKARALILHGYGEHGGRYREVAAVLHDLGVSSFALDFRGHGRSAGARGHTDSFELYLQDLEAAITTFEGEGPTELPLLFVAHSHGALIALRMLADPWRRPKNLIGAVISAPYLRLNMKVPLVKRAGARLLSRVLPTFTQASNIAIEDLTHDPLKLEERRLDTLCHDVATVRWYDESLKAQAWVREFAPRIDVPALWLVAQRDALADPKASREVFDLTGGGANKHWRQYDDAYHEVFNETIRDQAYEEMRQFIRGLLSTP